MCANASKLGRQECESTGMFLVPSISETSEAWNVYIGHIYIYIHQTPVICPQPPPPPDPPGSLPAFPLRSLR